MDETRSFYLAAYDISSNKRRAKIARIMESMGARVQGSVFEIWLNEKEFALLVKRSQKVLNEKEDSLRLYFLCGACQSRITIYGTGKATQAPELMII